MKLILLRGVPGSGKSTYAKTNFPDFPLMEADTYFIGNDGVYRFNKDYLPDAHRWCQVETRSFLRRGQSVVVANTFTRIWELEPYLCMGRDLGAEVEIYRLSGDYSNVHGVPPKIVEVMRDRMEDVGGEIFV